MPTSPGADGRSDRTPRSPCVVRLRHEVSGIPAAVSCYPADDRRGVTLNVGRPAVLEKWALREVQMGDVVEGCALYLYTLLRVMWPEIRTAGVEEVVPDADEDVDVARLERPLQQAHDDWDERVSLDRTNIESEVRLVDAPIATLSAKGERCRNDERDDRHHETCEGHGDKFRAKKGRAAARGTLSASLRLYATSLTARWPAPRLCLAGTEVGPCSAASTATTSSPPIASPTAASPTSSSAALPVEAA